MYSYKLSTRKKYCWNNS